MPALSSAKARTPATAKKDRAKIKTVITGIFWFLPNLNSYLLKFKF